MPITYEYPTATVSGKGGSFEVRGMSLEDITRIAELYLADMQKAVVDFGARRQMIVERSTVAEFILLVAKDFPAMAAEIISRAADDPGSADKVRRMPFAIQIQALQEIFRLTTEEAGGLKNALAVLAATMDAAPGNEMSGPIVTRLKAIIGGFAKTSLSSSSADTPMQPDIR